MWPDLIRGVVERNRGGKLMSNEDDRNYLSERGHERMMKTLRSLLF